MNARLDPLVIQKFEGVSKQIPEEGISIQKR
jgi:hypothetical protein